MPTRLEGVEGVDGPVVGRAVRQGALPQPQRRWPGQRQRGERHWRVMFETGKESETKMGHKRGQGIKDEEGSHTRRSTRPITT
jgi:hypothetical protein